MRRRGVFTARLPSQPTQSAEKKVEVKPVIRRRKPEGGSIFWRGLDELPPNTLEYVMVWNWFTNSPQMRVSRTVRQDIEFGTVKPCETTEKVNNIALLYTHWAYMPEFSNNPNEKKVCL